VLTNVTDRETSLWHYRAVHYISASRGNEFWNNQDIT